MVFGNIRRFAIKLNVLIHKLEVKFVRFASFIMQLLKLEDFLKKKFNDLGGGLYYSDDEINNFKEVFSLVSPVIQDYINKYNFLLEQYPYGYPKCSLFFRRRIGGVAQIYIDYLQGTRYEFIVGVIWSVDEFETETRHSKYVEIGRFKYAGELKFFSRLLEKALKTIKNWKLEDLDQHHGGMTIWKQHWHTKEEFLLSEQRRYPLLDM